MPQARATNLPLEPAPALSPSRKPPGWAFRLLLPSVSDAVFIILMFILFMSGSGWSLLLADGDTGLHIRTGDYILGARSVPARDLFSFTSPATPWFAWEWLSDVGFALVHRMGGFRGVALLSALVICFALWLLFRHMIARGVSVPIAVALIVVASDAMRFHFIARPHIFTTLLTVVTVRILDRDWERPGRALWLMVPLTVLWTNLHGGFLVAIVALALFAAASLLLREWSRVRRYAVLGALCSAATMVNPYGWRLHAHLWEYLRAGWLSKIDEFQSPSFHTEPMWKFEILLFLGLVSVAALARARRWNQVLLLLFWAHAALSAVRHVTIYVISAVTPIGEQLSRWWSDWAATRKRGSIAGSIGSLARDLAPAASRTSAWIPVFAALLIFGAIGGPWPAGFPREMFPVDLLRRNAALLAAPENANARILNPDRWGGFLAYELYPQRREFIDGRSDYYGPAILNDYSTLRYAGVKWRDLLDRYQFRFALIPSDWPLAQALQDTGQWVVRDHDEVGVLLERREGGGR